MSEYRCILGGFQMTPCLLHQHLTIPDHMTNDLPTTLCNHAPFMSNLTTTSQCVTVAVSILLVNERFSHCVHPTQEETVDRRPPHSSSLRLSGLSALSAPATKRLPECITLHEPCEVNECTARTTTLMCADAKTLRVDTGGPGAAGAPRGWGFWSKSYFKSYPLSMKSTPPLPARSIADDFYQPAEAKMLICSRSTTTTPADRKNKSLINITLGDLH